MPVSLVALVLFSAVLHALWNAAVKSRPDAGAAGFWLVLGAAIISAVLAIASSQAYIPPMAWPWVATAGLVEGLYFSSLLVALAHLPLQQAYGVSRGLGVLLAWPLAMVWQLEQASPLALVGAGLLSLGLLSTAWQQVGAPQGHLSGRGWAATLVCALSIALYPLVYKQALSVGAPPYALFATSLALSLPIQAAWLGRTRWRRLQSEIAIRPMVLLACAGLCAASFLALLGALQTGGAAHLSALRNTSVILAAALASRQHRLPPAEWWRAAAVTVGAVLVAL